MVDPVVSKKKETEIPEVNSLGDPFVGKSKYGDLAYRGKDGVIYITETEVAKEVRKEEKKKKEEEEKKKKEDEGLKNSKDRETNMDKELELDPYDPYEWFVKKTLRRDVNVSQ